MDIKKLWQWRIMHVKRFSRYPDPFYHSNKFGLDFNVTSNTQKKLDLHLVTNGVILEICDFAKTVVNKRRLFLTTILENSFDLRLENEQQRTDFTSRIDYKIKDLIKRPPEDKSEVFTLFDASSKPECNSNNGLNLASTELKTEIFPGKMDDTDDSEHEDKFRCSQATSSEYTKTESLSEEMDEAPGDDCKHQDELKCSGAQSAELMEDVLPSLLPYCEQIGLSLDVGSKQSLDPGLLTKGVMLELVDFARILTSSYNTIVCDVLEHNFDLDLKSPQARYLAFSKMSYMLKRRKRVMSTCSKTIPEFENELFSLQINPKRRTKGSALSNMEAPQHHFEGVTKIGQSDLKTKQEKRPLLTTIERVNKRLRMGASKVMVTNSLSNHTDLCSNQTAEGDHCHTFPQGESYLNSDPGSEQCLNVMKQEEMGTENYYTLPLGESHLDSDKSTESGNNQDHLQNSKKYSLGSDIAIESDLSCLGIYAPFLTTTDISSSVPAVNSNVDSPLASQSDGGKEQTQTQRNVPNKCNMEQEEMGTENDYICPLGESDLDLDEVTDSENTGNQDHLQNPKSCSLGSDIAIESELSCLGMCAPFLTITDISSSLPAVNSNVNAPSVSQPDERGLCGGEEQTETPKNVPNRCDVEQEKLGTENIMWKLRANRVKQVLSSANKEYDAFHWSKTSGLEFNVGFGPKQNISVDSLPEAVLFDLAKFALSMNSSQQHFIMEILEYNFDFSLQSEHQRNIFTCEIMNRIRKLKSCEDAVKISKEIFELPAPMSSINMANQSVGTVNHELSSMSKMEECDAAPVDPPHSPAETKEGIPQEILDLYPFCREIGLTLHGHQCQQNKKLDINTLTNGAMLEVTNFAEKLCGTFEQICLDILKHNLDLESQSGDSDLARSIVARIPAVVERKHFVTCKQVHKKITHKRRDSLSKGKLECQNNQTLAAYSAGSSQPTIIDQDVGSSTDIEHQDMLNLKLWKLRGNHIQHILSIPHEEHCPLYSYSRCKKLGIDFNVGSGVKQNLDPRLLTNGIMVEICTFTIALLSAQQYFITEILEYNFPLHFNNELDRSAFAQQTLDKIRGKAAFKKWSRKKMAFELPDITCTQEPAYGKSTFCPKCYQDRKHKRCQDESDLGHMQLSHPHSMTDTVSAEANCTTKKPAKDPSSIIEKTIMDSYPLCKKIGLSLCVNKDQPKDKLDAHILTLGMMVEVAHFARKLCATKSKIIQAVLEHNFSISMQKRDVDIGKLLSTATAIKDDGTAWFSEVFVFPPFSHTQSKHASKLNKASRMQRSEMKEAIKKRKLALQTKNRTIAPSHSDVKLKTHSQNKGNSFPTCTEIGLDLDMTSKSGEKEKLDLKPLKRAVCDMEQEEMVTEKKYACPLGESDLDSDEIADSGSEEQTQTPGKAPNECDMEQEEMGTENDIWKLRANRVKQILSTVEFGPFSWSEKFGLEYNIGFGPKQSISVDSYLISVLLEVAKFALAMNSSQQHFIMEILGYNFDLCLHSEQQKDVFACEIMKRVRKLKTCEDAVKISKEIFELPGLMPSINMANQSIGTVNHEFSSVSRMEECDVAPGDPPHSPAEAKEHVSQTIVELYPFCREIGLKLHVNQRKQNKKLNMNKLTNGAMIEVTNFAEKLCGTFERICLDILRHNLDFDLQSGDSDLGRSIVAHIPVLMERKNLSISVSVFKKVNRTARKVIIGQDLGSSADIEHQDELSLKLWKLRANHIQHILSIPHEEDCPHYSYSRCKKLGIDFNVPSGVKQNLDPRLLTNGIMVEVGIFAIALLSAQKYFITEILEYNFPLDFNDELHRIAFAQQTMDKIRLIMQKKNSPTRMKMLFELSDLMCIEKPDRKTIYCPKCCQDRKYKFHQDESDHSHMHLYRPPMIANEVSADTNCKAQKPVKDPTSTFSKIEEIIMDSYPLCKKIGLNLCVDKDQPKDKLDTHVLTGGIMVEVATFAKLLCATRSEIIQAVLEHNFNIDMQKRDVDIPQLFHRATTLMDDGLDWFNKVFVFPSFSHRQPGPASKPNEASPMQRSEMKEAIKKRKLALQTKEERATLPPHNTSVIKKSKTRQRNTVPVNCYPICTEIGLDLDVTSKAGEKENLDLNLLTRAVVLEIHKFAIKKKSGQYLPHTVFDILDYNFDLSSQHHRRWEFSIATTSKVQSMVKQYRKTRSGADEVFKLPFVLPPKKRQNKKPKRHSQEESGEKTNDSNVVCQVRHHSDVSQVHFLDGVKTNEEAWCHDEDTKVPTDPGTMVQIKGSLENVGCGSPLQGNSNIKEEENDPHYGNMKPEPDTEEKYHPHYDDVKTEPNTEDIKHLVPGEPSGPLGYTLLPLWPNPERQEAGSENQNVQYYILAEPQGSAACPNTVSNIKTEWDTEGVQYFVPVEAAGSQEYSMVTTGHNNESTLIKEEQENVPVGSHHC